MADRQWSFHTMMFSSGVTETEVRAKSEIVDAIMADTELCSWTRQTSYRVVQRVEIESVARQTEAEELALLSPDPAQATQPVVRHPGAPQPPVEPPPVTPEAMALAVQKMLSDDHRSFLEFVHAESQGTTSRENDEALVGSASQHPLTHPVEIREEPPTRIYLLVDYPASSSEAQQLLLLGEVGAKAAVDVDIPLLPLLDGVLLLVDPTRDLRERRRSVSGGDDRRKSGMVRRLDLDATGKPLEEISPAATLTAFQTANDSVKDLYEAMNVGGMEWNDFVFAELHCSYPGKEIKETQDLTQEILESMEALAAQKFAFKQWISTTKMISIPALDADHPSGPTNKAYQNLLQQNFSESISVSTILEAMVDAVVLASKERLSVQLDKPAELANNQQYMEEFLDFGDIASVRLARAYASFVSLPKEKQVKEPLYYRGRRIDEIEKTHLAQSDLIGVGNNGRKGMPRVATYSAAERSIQDTELAAFSSVPISHVHLTRQLLTFEHLLGSSWKDKLWRRQFSEELSRTVFPQRLASLIRLAPAVHKEYHEATDSLLLALITPTAPGRFRFQTWGARDCVRHRPAFRNWRREQLPPDEYLTPRTAHAATTCVSLSAAQLNGVTEKCYSLFPADQSLIRLFQTARMETWLTVYRHGDVYGFRPLSEKNGKHNVQFYASFEDDSFLNVKEGCAMPKKPDGFPSITVVNTFASGLAVTACSDGSIIQQYASPQPVSPGVRELYRVISGKGSVACVMEDGSILVMLANGDIRKTNADALDTERDEEMTLTVDPETNAVVERRGNGVMVVTHTDGSRTTYHADGTRIFSNAAQSHVLVAKEGYAQVFIDIEVNLTAQRHACGERVAVTKGGLRRRSAVYADDGTSIYLRYDTRVIAAVNGIITTKKPDGTIVSAMDNGRVEYRPSPFKPPRVEEMANNDFDATDPAVGLVNGVYYFDCLHGRFQMCDQEQNQFTVDMIGENGGQPRASVDLAGVVSEAELQKYAVSAIPAKAAINDPIEPYLFIIHGDGTAREILRPRDVEQFLAGKSTAQCFPFPSLAENDHATMVDSFQSSANVMSAAKIEDERVRTEMERLMRPVSTAAQWLIGFPWVRSPDTQFTIVRRLLRVPPISAPLLEQMGEEISRWRQWQAAREANKDQYKVFDPRDAEIIAQEMILQKKVIAAYRATRSRKRMERMRNRENQLKMRQEKGVALMETVEEGEESRLEDEEDEEEEDEFDQYGGSEGSETDSRDDFDVDVDDPDELLWTAFSQAAPANQGTLTRAETRKALVHALGIGVTTSEVAEALQSCKFPDSAVTFDMFAVLVDYIRARLGLTTEKNEKHSFMEPHPEVDGASGGWGGESPRVPAGSAAKAVKSSLALRLNHRKSFD
ncbi:TPA: hypothetical protein N0F65_004310 [Lagenidium giganteum]|uniref:Uncharacterized protein n=1 Tax=Lagenidium giganteum TaxID=4803 RepID=A0AAV2ZFV1_9STRA|nr:TPA: hypothetical protein N0F65_004310 [Lagenidium giganteum]